MYQDECSFVTYRMVKLRKKDIPPDGIEPTNSSSTQLEFIFFPLFFFFFRFQAFHSVSVNFFNKSVDLTEKYLIFCKNSVHVFDDFSTTKETTKELI